MKLYTTLTGRFFALPDDLPLPDGPSPVRRLLGPPERADLDALAPYEVSPPEARDLAHQILADADSPLGQLEASLLTLQERLRSPEGQRALQQIGARLKQIGTDARVRAALRKLDREPSDP